MMMSSMGHFFMPVNQNNMDFKNTTYVQSYQISIEKFNFQGLYLVCHYYLLFVKLQVLGGFVLAAQGLLARWLTKNQINWDLILPIWDSTMYSIPWRYLNVEESSRCHGVVVHIRIISDDHMTSHLDFLGHIHKREWVISLHEWRLEKMTGSSQLVVCSAVCTYIHK